MITVLTSTRDDWRSVLPRRWHSILCASGLVEGRFPEQGDCPPSSGFVVRADDPWLVGRLEESQVLEFSPVLVILTADVFEWPTWADPLQAMRCGALVMAAAEDPQFEQQHAIDALAQERRYVTSAVLTRWVVPAPCTGPTWVAPSALAEAADPTADRYCDLTLRQREVLRLVGAGASYAQVAASLRIRASTVKDHLTKARSALGVASSAGAVGEATRRNLL